MLRTLRTKRSGPSSHHGHPVRPYLECLENRLVPSATDVLTYHNDNLRTGQNLNETTLTPANVNQYGFGKLFQYAVDGQVYAQPLYKTGVSIGGVPYDVVFIATEHNSVYAFNADSPTGGPNHDGLLWRTNFNVFNNTMTITSVPASGDPGPMAENYDPINNPLAVAVVEPEVGITSTPVISGNTLYVMTLTQEIPAGSDLADYKYTLRALDISTGAQTASNVLADTRREYSKNEVASDPGTYVSGPHAGTVYFFATRQLQRPALTLANGKIYSSFGDFSEYKLNSHDGWVVANNVSDLSFAGAIASIPNPLSPDICAEEPGECGQAGIWMSGDGPAVDAAGNLYVATGDGHFDSKMQDYGDSIVRLPGDLSSVTDSFTPYNQLTLNQSDADLGSGGVLALPDQPGMYPHLLVQAGKQGTLYLLNREGLGGYNDCETHMQCDPCAPYCDHVVQEIPTAHVHSFDTPAYFNGMVYYAGVGDTLKEFTLSGGLFNTTPVQGANTFNFPGATPSISAAPDMTNAIVWVVDPGNGNAVLRAYNAIPQNGILQELYNSDQACGRDQLDQGVKFAVPTVSNGKVYATSYIGDDTTLTRSTVTVFGLLSSPTVGPTSLIQSDYVTNGHGDYEAVALSGTNLNHYSYIQGTGWRFDETITTHATCPGALIQSDYITNGHGHLEVVVPEGNNLSHYTLIDGSSTWVLDEMVPVQAPGIPSLIQSDYVDQGHRHLEVVVPVGASLNHYTFIQGSGWQFDDTVVTDATGPGALIQSDYITNGHGHLEVVVPEGNSLNHYTLIDGSSGWEFDDTVTTNATGPASMVQSDYFDQGHGHVEVVVPEDNYLNHYTFIQGSGWGFDDSVTPSVSGPASLIQSDFVNLGHRHLELVVPAFPLPGTASLSHYTFKQDTAIWQFDETVTTGPSPSPRPRDVVAILPRQSYNPESQLSDGPWLDRLANAPAQAARPTTRAGDGWNLTERLWLLDAAFGSPSRNADDPSAAGDLPALLTGQSGDLAVLDLPFIDFGQPLRR